MRIKSILLAAVIILVTNYSKAQQITVYTIGDSTMANKPNPEENPERGWGQMLGMPQNHVLSYAPSVGV